MDTLTITELARTAGVPSSTLRYYDRIGILRSAGRAENGYRRYDDRSVARLAFIGRAKRLGLDLDAIATLVRLWDGEQCVTVQARLLELVSAKGRQTRARIDELAMFAAELEAAGDLLVRGRAGADAGDAACGPNCVCTDAGDGRMSSIAVADSEPAIACSLEIDERSERGSAWHALVAASDAVTITDGIRLRLAPRYRLAEVASLVEREIACCPFFRFSIGVTADGIELEIGAPPEARSMLIALLGAASEDHAALLA